MIDLLTANAREVIAYVEASVAAGFVAEDADRARGPHHLGLSALGGCTRAAAYALSRTPASDQPPPSEGRAANLGTWEHAGLLPRLAEQMGGQVEVPLVLRAAGVELPGHADLLPPGGVLDLKTVGEYRLQTVRRVASPYHSHRVQVMGYALAALQQGHRVRWVIWLYMDRATGQVEVIVEEFVERRALEVIDRVSEVRRYAAAPDDAPREERGPGLSLVCDGCWFLRRCWGDDAEPERVGAQRSLVAGAMPSDVAPDPRAVWALSRYADAAAREGEARRDKEFYAAVLDGLPHGQYGPWKLRRGKSSTVLDQSKVREDYEKGIFSPTLPVKPQRGRLLVTLMAADGGKSTKEVTT